MEDKLDALERQLGRLVAQQMLNSLGDRLNAMQTQLDRIDNLVVVGGWAIFFIIYLIVAKL